MQKIIVSLAIICGLMVATTQLKAANRYRIQPVVTVCMQDSGFVLTKLEALNEIERISSRQSSGTDMSVPSFVIDGKSFFI